MVAWASLQGSPVSTLASVITKSAHVPGLATSGSLGAALGARCI